jgi:hypothetical protein
MYPNMQAFIDLEKDFKTENTLWAIQVLITHAARPPAFNTCDEPTEVVQFLDGVVCVTVGS